MNYSKLIKCVRNFFVCGWARVILHDYQLATRPPNLIPARGSIVFNRSWEHVLLGSVDRKFNALICGADYPDFKPDLMSLCLHHKSPCTQKSLIPMPPTRARETNPGHPQYGGRQSPLRTRESPSPILTDDDDDDDADEETISQDDDEEDDDEQETTGGSSS